MSEPRGLRALPLSLQLAYALSLTAMVVESGVYLTVNQPWLATRFGLTMRGIGFASEVLGVYGMLELARRLTGRAALGCMIAAVGLGLIVASGVGWVVLDMKSDLFTNHRWVYDANQYVHFSTALVVLGGIVLAAWQRRAIAIATLVVGLLTWPPPFLAKHMFSWIPDSKLALVLPYVLMTVRLVMLVVAVVTVARGSATPNRELAASGLRTIANALWLRLIAAVSVVLLTLLAVGASAQGAIHVIRFATIAGSIVSIIALAQFGLGALRAARSGLVDLGGYTLTVAGACALWVAGVTLTQLSYVYRALYDTGDFASSLTKDYIQALSIAVPIVGIASVAFVAIAIGGLAAQRRAEPLREQAQAKGIGSVLLMLASVGIQAWIVPSAASQSSLVVMMVFAASISLVATVLMARLCTLAAEELERDASLPTATVTATAEVIVNGRARRAQSARGTTTVRKCERFNLAI